MPILIILIPVLNEEATFKRRMLFLIKTSAVKMLYSVRRFIAKKRSIVCYINFRVDTHKLISFRTYQISTSYDYIII